MEKNLYVRDLLEKLNPAAKEALFSSFRKIGFNLDTELVAYEEVCNSEIFLDHLQKEPPLYQSLIDCLQSADNEPWRKQVKEHKVAYYLLDDTHWKASRHSYPVELSVKLVLIKDKSLPTIEIRIKRTNVYLRSISVLSSKQKELV